MQDDSLLFPSYPTVLVLYASSQPCHLLRPTKSIRGGTSSASNPTAHTARMARCYAAASAGTSSFRHSLARFLTRQYGYDVPVESLATTNGNSHGKVPLTCHVDSSRTVCLQLRGSRKLKVVTGAPKSQSKAATKYEYILLEIKIFEVRSSLIILNGIRLGCNMRSQPLSSCYVCICRRI